MALEHFKTQVLLLHSQQDTLDALGAGFNERFSVHFATTGSEALNTLGETPIHVIVSAQDLPGMSGLEALREAKKRSPDTVGILLAGDHGEEDFEAMVGEQEMFQIVRGPVQPDMLLKIVEDAARRVRMLTISQSANDNEAAKPARQQPAVVPNEDTEEGEHIIMETMANGASVITDATGSMVALQPDTKEPDGRGRERSVDVLVLSKDEEFLNTIRACARGLHDVHHAVTAQQAQDIVANNKVGVLVTDAAIAGNKVALLTQKLRTDAPRLVAIVAGRRDDGESLMELINQGKVYRFLLKPVSPGRARLAVEACVKYHLDAPDSVFAGSKQTGEAPPPAEPAASPVAVAKPPAAAKPAQEVVAVKETEDSLALTDKFVIPNMEKLAAESEGADEGIRMPVIPLAVAALLMLGVGGWFVLSGSDNIVVPQTAPQNEPTVAVEEAVPAPVEAAVEDPYLSLLDNARFARDSGRLLAPAGDNALEWYLEARLAAPDNTIVRDELAALVDQVLGMAETAMLENRINDVDAALQMVALADPDNARLAFLNAQRDQQLARATLDEARAAIRGGRYEDAGRLLTEATEIPGANLGVIDQLTEDLAAARSAARIDDVLALANERLVNGQLTAPANDNARYFFQLAASNAPGNTAAQQGLLVVASKLVLSARAAIDAGELETAGAYLADARTLDPNNADLIATEQALQKSLEFQAEASRRAAAARQSAAQELATRQAAEEQRRAGSTATLTNNSSEPAAAASKPAATTYTQTGGIANSATDYAPAAAAENGVLDNSLAGSIEENAPATLDPSTATGAANPTQAPAISQQGTPQRAGPAQIEQVAISQLTRNNYVAPQYPRSAQRRNVSGWVNIAFTVTPRGSVGDIEIIESLPGTIFDNSAREAVAQWRFEPVVENGQAVPKRVAVRLSFSLQ